MAITTDGTICTGSGTGSATITMANGTGTGSVYFNQAGNSNYNAATQITESVTANKANQTITVTTHAPSSAAYNSTFTVAATSSSGLSVTITTDGSVCTGSGSSSTTITMASGTGTGHVYYNQAGNSNYNAATQATDNVTASKASTATSLSSTLNPSAPGETVTFTASVTPSAATGTVTFKDGATTLVPNSTVSSGQATYTISTLSSGTHSITAVYNGDSNCTGSTSSALTETVVIRCIGFGTAATGTTSIAPSLPTGYAVNDIFLLFVETANQTVTTPSGWTIVTNSPQGTGTAGGTSATGLSVFWKRAASTSESAPTVTISSGNHAIGQIMAFRGCVTSGNPWDVTAGNVASTASKSVSIPGATTSVNNCLIILAVAYATDTTTPQTSAWTNANLTGVTEVVDNATATGNGGGFGVATGLRASAGNYGTTSATLSTSSVQGRMSIALKPAY